MSGPLRISQYPATTAANATDEMVANQNGTTVKLTVGQVRATLAPAVHTHGEADIIGTIAPSKLAQAGASSGQVLKWNGSAWAPAADTVGSGGGSTDWSALTGMPPAIDAIDTLTPAADRLAYYTGTDTAALAIVTGFARSLLDDADAAAARGTLGAAAAAHGHAIADVASLQAALDGKAAAAHTHTEADITGTIAPGRLAQAGASSGQVLKWNGTVWAPAADNVGTGGGSTDWSALTGVPAAIDAIDNLTPAADRVAYYTGTNAAALAVVTGFARSLLDDADAATARGTLAAAAATHGHAIGDVASLQTALDGKAATSHTHAIGDVTNLQTALDGKAATSHTHTIANVTNLQAALDAKAALAHTHTEADITGTIAPSKLAQAGASSGQVLKWNGTVWAPAADNVGTGGTAGYASQRTMTATGSITDADRNGVVFISGAGITATFIRTGFSARDRVLLINIGTAAATISAGTDGFNTSGNNSFILFPGEEREVVYEGSAIPYWRVGVPGTIQLAANQVATLNNAGTAFEARTAKEVWSLFLPISGNVAGGAAAGQLGMWGNKPCTLTAVRVRTLGGACSIQIRKNGTPISGFAAAVGQTTAVTSTASSEPLAQDNLLDVVVTNASSLTGLFITFLGVRTAD